MPIQPYPDSQARLIAMTDDQMKLVAHLISLVDRSKITFVPDEPFLISVRAEADSLQELFGEDNSLVDRKTVLGFCL